MTYDIVVWKHKGHLDDQAASLEFERRFEESESRFPNSRPAESALSRLADMLEVRFPDAPWEELRGAIDGDFMYLNAAGSEAGSQVEEYIAEIAGELGLLVYSPITDTVTSWSGQPIEADDPEPTTAEPRARGMDALAAYDYLQKELLGPELRSLGFKGSKGTFHLPNEAGDYAMLSFEKSPEANRDSCRFDIGLFFYTRDDWEQARVRTDWLPVRPDGKHRWDVGWEESLSQLMTPYRDYPFGVYNPKSARAVSRQIMTLVQRLVMPEFAARMGKQTAP